MSPIPFSRFSIWESESEKFSNNSENIPILLKYFFVLSWRRFMFMRCLPALPAQRDCTLLFIVLTTSCICLVVLTLLGVFLRPMGFVIGVILKLLMVLVLIIIIKLKLCLFTHSDVRLGHVARCRRRRRRLLSPRTQIHPIITTNLRRRRRRRQMMRTYPTSITFNGA